MLLPEFLSNVTGYELAGLAGAGLYAGNYTLVACDRLSCLSPVYYASQLTAASLVMASLTVQFNLASAAIQAFFICVSLVGVWRHTGRGRRRVRERADAL